MCLFIVSSLQLNIGIKLTNNSESLFNICACGLRKLTNILLQQKIKTIHSSALCKRIEANSNSFTSHKIIKSLQHSFALRERIEAISNLFTSRKKLKLYILLPYAKELKCVEFFYIA